MLQRRLEDMLQHTEEQAELAALHYEIWKMTQKDTHRQTTLDLYHKLYASTPNIEYKERMEELQGLGISRDLGPPGIEDKQE